MPYSLTKGEYCLKYFERLKEEEKIKFVDNLLEIAFEVEAIDIELPKNWYYEESNPTPFFKNMFEYLNETQI